MQTSRNKGSALLSALFIMTMIAIAAIAMATRLQLDIYRTRISLASDKLYLAAQLVQFWGLSELANPNQKFYKADAAGKVLDFPEKFKAIYPDFQIKGSLYDLQSRFNLNNVSDSKYQIAFQTLLKNTARKIEPEQRNSLGFALYNWLIPYQPGHEATNNLSYYLKQKPPYYPAQQFMQNQSEFRLVMGVTAPLYRQMQSYLIALPEITTVNLNTASKPVLLSLGLGLDEKGVNELIETRGKKGISDLNKLSLLLQKLNIRPEQVSIESQYFMTVATVRFEDLRLTSYSVLKRKKEKNGKITVSIVGESLNAFD